ncbi:MAG TPA: hypothetical protein PLS63_08360 [Microthrixaceae bacterium]|nr:hypothetical protein [Microthrixaceae bacterium]
MIQLVDDQLLGQILRGADPPDPTAKVYTTGYWYVRVCQAVLTASGRPGSLSAPFLGLPAGTRERTIQTLLELPPWIGLLSLRDLGPGIGRLRSEHRLNILGIEALAAAVALEAHVHLSAPSPKLQEALEAEGRTVTLV